MNAEKILWLLVVLFYGFGIPGILLFPSFFLPFSPLSLILGAAFLVHTIAQKDVKFFVGFVFTFIATWWVEWVGVNTGLLFGTYHYGPTLGIAVDGIPIIIGLNWCTMLLYSQHISLHFFPSASRLVSALIAGLHMTILDLIMEYVAPKLGFWQFQDAQGNLMNYAPLHNFVGWLVVSTLFAYLAFGWNKEKADRRKLKFALVNWLFFAALAIGFAFSKV